MIPSTLFPLGGGRSDSLHIQIISFPAQIELFEKNEFRISSPKYEEFWIWNYVAKIFLDFSGIFHESMVWGQAKLTLDLKVICLNLSITFSFS